MKCFNQRIENDYALYHGDSVEVVRSLPSNSMDFQIWSPPFSQLYIYSDSNRDLGNCKDDAEFFQHFAYLVPELLRITRPGRLCAVHCKNLVNYKGTSGRAGLRDFRGDIIRAMEAADWQYHSEVCIWKDPVIEMQRTKAHGLLHKQLCKDSTFSRQGLPDYLVIFRKWANESSEEEVSLIQPVTSGNPDVRFDSYVGTDGPPIYPTYPGDTKLSKSDVDRAHRQDSIAVWQRYASPVWFDIQQTNVLNARQARGAKDEKHICPLQLDVIDRAIHLWTNLGDTVFTPFLGIGSECYQALKMGRKAVGIELKEEYFQAAIKNCQSVIEARKQLSIFDVLEEGEDGSEGIEEMRRVIQAARHGLTESEWRDAVPVHPELELEAA